PGACRTLGSPNFPPCPQAKGFQGMFPSVLEMTATIRALSLLILTLFVLGLIAISRLAPRPMPPARVHSENFYHPQAPAASFPQRSQEREGTMGVTIIRNNMERQTGDFPPFLSPGAPEFR